MKLNAIGIGGEYKRSLAGLLVLGSLLSFALGQRVGHGHAATLNVAQTHIAPIVSIHTNGAIGTVIVTQSGNHATQTGNSLLSQSTNTGHKHGHGHGKADGLVMLVTLDHHQGDGEHSRHKDGGDGSQGD